jgi:hypothetical protein
MATIARRLMLTLAGTIALALQLPEVASAGETMLTIVDDRAGIRVALGAAELDALPQHRIETHTEFTEGLTEFRGPLARDALAMVGVMQASELRMYAVNDYSVSVPFSDLETYDVVLATEMNGERLSVRNRGPIWLMYPLDGHPELRGSVYNDRLIWQLVRIETH